MLFKNYKNIPIVIDNRNILASDISISVGNEIQPLYLSERRHSFENFPRNSVTSSISLNYFLTGSDPIKTRFIEDRNLALTENVITGNIGGLFFNSGYLTSYSINAQANAPISVNAQILVFDDIHGSLENAPNPISNRIKPLNTSDCELTIYNTEKTSYSQILSFSYEYSADIQPFYVISNVTGFSNLLPANVHYGEKRIVSNLVTNDPSGILGLKSDSLAYRVSFRDKNSQEKEFIYSSGTLTQKNISARTKDITTNSLTIVQNYIQQPPIIESVSSISGDPGTLITLNGQNLYPTTALFFGDKKSDYVVQAQTNSIRARIPTDAVSGELKIRTFGGEYTFPTGFIPNSQTINIDGLSKWVGANGDNVTISGGGFYSISNIYYGDQSANFIRINNQTIKSQVPENFTRGFVTVKSNIRNVSGTSAVQFVTLPQITGFTPLTGVSGTLVSIKGKNFTGVVNVEFNSIYATGYDVISNSEIITYVPSGNVFGPIRVSEGQLSILAPNETYAISPYNFRPRVSLTGLFPTGGYGGSGIRISGVNLYRSILQKSQNSPFPNDILVDFNGGVTGFQLIEPDTLIGVIPYNATDGPVRVYALQEEVSAGDFDRTYEIGSTDDPEFEKKNDPPMILYTARPEIRYGGTDNPWVDSPYSAGVKVYGNRNQEIVVYNFYRDYGHASSDFTVPVNLRNSNQNYSYPAAPAIWPIRFNYYPDDDDPKITPTQTPMILLEINGKNFFDVDNVLVTGLGSKGIGRYWYSNGDITGGFIKRQTRIDRGSTVPNIIDITQSTYESYTGPNLIVPNNYNGTKIYTLFPVTLATYPLNNQEFQVVVNALEGSTTGNAYWRLNRLNYSPTAGSSKDSSTSIVGFQYGDYGLHVKIKRDGSPHY